MERARRAPHVLIMPFPVEGHINPMLQFAKRLASKDLKVTFLTTPTNTGSLRAQQGCNFQIQIEPIYDKLDDSPIEAFVDKFKAIASRNLPGLIDKLGPVNCLVYDSALPWALDIAKKSGLIGASFFTQACAVGAVYCNIQRGVVGLPIQGTTVSLPGLPKLGVRDLPSFIYDVDSYPSLLDLGLNRFSNVDKADWMLFNTFDSLEQEAVSWMAGEYPIRTIGPTIPSMHIDKRLKDDKDYGLSLFKPDTEVCMKWLDSKEANSVVYVSFGSLAGLGDAQMEELAEGFLQSNRDFLWVVRASEESKLPSNFKSKALGRGLIVNWCPQLEVLAHQAVGCFMTHCGWNSTLEALSQGVPMVAMPQWTDQTTNAKFIADIWRAGVRVTANENGIVTREEVARSINYVMDGERSNELRSNAVKWKQLAKEAVDEGGSSDKNIDEFVSRLACM